MIIVIMIAPGKINLEELQKITLMGTAHCLANTDIGSFQPFYFFFVNDINYNFF